MNIKLKNLREERKISQAKMAKALNISQPQYQRKEVGDTSFTEDEFETLADFLSVPVSEIKDSNTISQNHYNQKGGVAQNIMYYIADKLVDEVKELNNILRSELTDCREENKKLKRITEKLLLLNSLRINFIIVF